MRQNKEIKELIGINIEKKESVYGSTVKERHIRTLHFTASQ